MSTRRDSVRARVARGVGLALVALLASGTVARAQPAPAAKTDPAALEPAAVMALYGFSLDELRLELRQLLPGAEDDADAIAAATGARALDADRLQLVYQGRKRTVPLVGLRGAAAARSAASYLLELANRPPPSVPAVPILQAKILDEQESRAADRRAPKILPGNPRALVSFTPAIGVGNEVSLLLRFGVGTSVRVWRGLRVSLDAAYAYGPDENRVRLHALDTKVGVGWWFGKVPIELRVSGLVRPTWAKSGYPTRMFVDGGMAVSAISAFAIRPSLRGILGVHVESLFTRHALQVRGVTQVATDRAALIFSLGLAWSSR